MAEATIDHLASDVERLRESDRQLAVDVRDITSGLAAVRAELRFALRIGGGLAALVLPLLGGLIWNAATLSSEVKHQGVRIDKLEAKVDQRFDKVDQHIDRLEQKVDQRFDQIIQRLDQGVAKKGGAP